MSSAIPLFALTMCIAQASPQQIPKAPVQTKPQVIYGKPKGKQPQVRFQEPRRFPLQRIVPNLQTLPIAPKESSAPAVPKMVAKPNGLVQFDNRGVRVKWINNRWELYAGNVWLKDFGRRQADAREAERVIRRLGLTQRGVIGSPAPVMEYWLAEGRAPRIAGPGFRAYPIDRKTLRLEKIGGHWCVRDRRQLLFNFGTQKTSADEAMSVIRRHGFTQIGYVGYPRPTMIYFGSDQRRSLRTKSLTRTSMASGEVPRKSLKKLVSMRKKQGEKPDPQTLDKRQQILKYQASLLARGYRQLAAPLTADARFRFDPRQAVLRPNGKNWQLHAGELVLGNFGPNAEQARRATQLLRDTGCNEYCLIGQDKTRFSYFLANGRAPRGIRLGKDARLIQPNKITVQQTQSGWCVCEGDQSLVSFGREKSAAENLVQVIRRHQIDRMVQMGNGMAFLARSR